MADAYLNPDGTCLICSGNGVNCCATQRSRASKTEDRTDTERLDWLQSQTKGYGRGWLVRNSTTGRGMRLIETSEEGAKPTVREAIDAAISEVKATGARAL